MHQVDRPTLLGVASSVNCKYWHQPVLVVAPGRHPEARG